MNFKFSEDSIFMAITLVVVILICGLLGVSRYQNARDEKTIQELELQIEKQQYEINSYEEHQILIDQDQEVIKELENENDKLEKELQEKDKELNEKQEYINYLYKQLNR